MTKSKSGFSKLSKEEKIQWILSEYFSGNPHAEKTLKQYWNDNESLQKLHDDFIENTLSNFYLPFAVAPNFRINGRYYTVPMVIEESSVVAAASKAAKFWSKRGGFTTTVLGTEKIGQVHFIYKGDKQKLITFFETVKPKFYENTQSITANMQKRGGGITSIELIDKTSEMEDYFQLHATFETKDSMGANFINSCLEEFAKTLKEEAQHYASFSEEERNIEVIMSILSNYVPNCVVRAEVSCKVEDLHEDESYARRFVQAVQIAQLEPYRAVTHNKGIMNGIDAVILATGNDFRAVEAGVHAYASRNGKYASLSSAEVKDGIFRFWLDVPLALGTVGGLTSLHPLVKFSLEMLGNPSAEELMQIVATAGLAQNFAALNSLTTTGIQQGHMKMHLMNILNQLSATEEEKKMTTLRFHGRPISHSAVVDFVENLRLRKEQN
jgi:hydroxymethylglutaryl-CoA reductase